MYLLPVEPAEGSIPACAGEPICAAFISLSVGVYPRLRGGTTGCQHLLPRSQGLSPLARGNLDHHRTIAVPVGSIPACAGEPPLMHW